MFRRAHETTQYNTDRRGQRSFELVMSSSKQETFIVKLFTYLLIFGCLIFVLHRGVQCFKKYLSNPESVNVAYDFTGKHPFPMLTFCLTANGYACENKTAFDENVLKECGLNHHQYMQENVWAGTKKEFCKNSTELYQRLTAKFEDLSIEEITILTFDGGQMIFNATNLNKFVELTEVSNYKLGY